MGYHSAENGKGKIEAARRMNRALKRMLVWGPIYPELESGIHFLTLKKSLEQSEELLGQLWMAYSNEVSELNTLEQSMRGPVANLAARIPN